MQTFLLMVGAILAGSALSLIGGATLFVPKKRRDTAILLALPFGAGALLAAAFFDLLPESFEMADPRELLVWTLSGFILFFLLERFATWFHHHHEHAPGVRHESQNRMVMIGDFLHNIIDGIAIGSAFLANPITGVITTIAVSAHEIPKELGTFGILLSRGWKDKKVLMINALTAVGTVLAASLVYCLGEQTKLPTGQLLALTSGFFIYVAASDIIPDIHDQPRKTGTLQAVVLVGAVVIVGVIIRLLGV